MIEGRLVAFEGAIASGKTTLASYFARKLRTSKSLERFEENPFLSRFYAGEDVILATEATFVMLHSAQLKRALKAAGTRPIISDFSVEKDSVYGQMNLKGGELRVFNSLYERMIRATPIPRTVIYLDVPFTVARTRQIRRGIAYELAATRSYFESYSHRLKNFFKNKSRSEVHFIEVSRMDLDNPKDPRLEQIESVLRNSLSLT